MKFSKHVDRQHTMTLDISVENGRIHMDTKLFKGDEQVRNFLKWPTAVHDNSTAITKAFERIGFQATEQSSNGASYVEMFKHPTLKDDAEATRIISRELVLLDFEGPEMKAGYTQKFTAPQDKPKPVDMNALAQVIEDKLAAAFGPEKSGGDMSADERAQLAKVKKVKSEIMDAIRTELDLPGRAGPTG